MVSQTIKVIAFISVLFWVVVACSPILESDGKESTGKIILDVDFELVDCVSVAPQKCLRTKADPDGEWQPFYAPSRDSSMEKV